MTACIHPANVVIMIGFFLWVVLFAAKWAYDAGRGEA